MTGATTNTVRGQIDARAATHSGATFLISPELETSITFGELQAGAGEIGARLDQLGVATGAKVAFLLDNGPWTVRLFLGIMASGRVVVPLNAVAGPSQLRHVLEHSDSELVFVAPRYRDRLDELLGQISRSIEVVLTTRKRGPRWPQPAPPGSVAAVATPTESDPALLLYTSGSTGRPKGALLSHGAVVRGGCNVADGHRLSTDDRALCVLPVYHINGAMVTVCAPLMSGGSVVMPRRFSASAFWQTTAKYRCTWASVVPTIINYLLDRAEREPFAFGDAPELQHFRFARSASAPLPKAVLQQWEKVFQTPMLETLGLTETAGTVAANPLPPAARKPGSVGLAHGVDIAIADAGDDSDGGEILIRGGSLLDCYYKDPAATEAAFTDGWFRTGDIGRLDEDGYLFITGRIKELILRGGENIAPREIDDVLYRHEAILEAAAVGVDHRDYGQEVVACVSLREGYACTEQELKEFCRASVGEVKAPKTIYFLDQLPKGPSGKILRLELPAIIAAINENEGGG